MSNYKDKYLKYKEKYSKLKNQIGSAPFDDLHPEPLLDNIDVLSQIKLAKTNKIYRDAFFRKYSGYNSTFAPDIVINIVYNNQPGCNRFITHYRIKDILNRNGIPIPDDGVNVIPILYPILLETIKTNNKTDAEFLVSVGVIIVNIDDYLFQGQELNSVYIPSCVTSIGIGAFADNQLTVITIPNSVTIINQDAFANNILLIVNLSQSLTTIESSAFANNSLSRIIIPQNVTTIEDNAFENNRLENIYIPLSVINIGFGAFRNNRLKRVDIDRNVLTIGWGAFYNNPIKNVTIRDNFNEQFDDLFDNPAGITFNLLS